MCDYVYCFVKLLFVEKKHNRRFNEHAHVSKKIWMRKHAGVACEGLSTVSFNRLYHGTPWNSFK